MSFPKTITEVQKAKQKLEQDIRILVENFEFETSTTVYALTVFETRKGKENRVESTIQIDSPKPIEPKPAETELKAAA